MTNIHNVTEKEINQELNKNINKRIREARIGIIAVIIIAIILAYWIKAGVERTKLLRQPQTTYQAIFLSNGQVYFGVIQSQNIEEVVLSDIYYFYDFDFLGDKNLSDTSLSNSQTKSDTLSLTKLGSELHSPTDEIRINRKHILFIEDLENNSQVIKAIRNFKEKQTN